MAKKQLSDQQVQAIAESLLPSFIPRNTTEDKLQFNFTAEGSHYRVEFVKDGKNWKFSSSQEEISE